MIHGKNETKEKKKKTYTARTHKKAPIREKDAQRDKKAHTISRTYAGYTARNGVATFFLANCVTEGRLSHASTFRIYLLLNLLGLNCASFFFVLLLTFMEPVIFGAKCEPITFLSHSSSFRLTPYAYSFSNKKMCKYLYRVYFSTFFWNAYKKRRSPA